MATAAQHQTQQRRSSGMEWDIDKVSETGPGLTPGTYLTKIISLIEGQTGKGKACWIGTFKVLPHPATTRHLNKQQKIWFTIGSDQDPLASNKNTVNESIGAGLLKRVFKKAKVKPLGEPGKLANWAKGAIGKQVLLFGTMRNDNNNNPRFNVTDFFEVGEREPEMIEPEMDETAEPPLSSENGAGAEAAGEVEGAIEEDMPGEEAGAEGEGPEPEAIEDETGAEEEPEPEPEPEAEEPPKQTKPKTQAKPTATASPTIPCGMCGKAIARDKYRTHVQTCKGK